MAGEEDPNRSQQPPSSPGSSRQWPEEENPFVAFRRFADEQISSMLRSVMGLPSLSAPPQSDRWSIFADEQDYRDTQARQRQRQDYNNGGKEYGDGSESRNQEFTPNRDNNFPLGPSRSRWSGPENLFDIDIFFDSFFDRFWLDDHVSSRFFHPYYRPLFSSMMSADSPAWPVNYLMFSPYSPLHLERQARYRSHREHGVFSSIMSSISLSSEYDSEEPRWREAFEDLLRLENGMSMLDREPGALAKPETGKEWLQSLVKRGSLGGHWKFTAGSESHPWSSITLERADRGRDTGRYVPEGEKSGTSTSTKDGTSEAFTELDMYDRFLADIETREREFFGDFHHSPLLRFLLEDRRRGKDAILPPEKEYQDEDTETWLELVSGGNKHSIADPSKESTPPSTSAVEAPPTTSPDKNSFVVSTQISTERVRLPDGSIQTKTMKTKRFADGREETNESTEVVNPPQHEQQSPDQQDPSPDQKKNGWFWKE
ncbi:uncharacterized protein BJX67DRAFT_263034 [Aspergillus lucknowensis]|uniref:Uncharacterized protein n=1 Tax=Aspergillus lucknowensis TaxID=176173 RepID=A0ABR4LFJ5_9EURO